MLKPKLSGPNKLRACDIRHDCLLLYHSDQPGWSLSSGGPPAGFSAGVIGHLGDRRQLRSVIIFLELSPGMSENP